MIDSTSVLPESIMPGYPFLPGTPPDRHDPGGPTGMDGVIACLQFFGEMVDFIYIRQQDLLQ